MSNKIDIAIADIRKLASELHEHLDEALTKGEAAAKRAYEEALVKAKELASSLRKQAQERQSGARQRATLRLPHLSRRLRHRQKQLRAHAARLQSRSNAHKEPIV